MSIRESRPRKTRRSFRTVGSFVLLVLLVANVAGYAFDLYTAARWFSRVLHAFTPFGITLWLALFVFASFVRAERPLLLVALFASVGVAICA